MKLKMSLIECFVVTGVVAFLAAVLIPAVDAVRKDYGGWTDPLPTSPPAEENRVYDARGFSMIIPPQWRQSEGVDDDAVAQIKAKSGYRYESTISAKLAHPRITAEHFPDTWRFNDRTLNSWQGEYEGKQFGSRWFVFEAALRDGDRLFLLTFGTHADVDGLPEIAAEYLRTFRLESEGAAHDAGHPGGGPQRSQKSTSTPATP